MKRKQSSGTRPVHQPVARECEFKTAGKSIAIGFTDQRHLGWQQKVTIHSLRIWLFVTAVVLSYPRGKTAIKLAVPVRERAWWRRPWEKILNPSPNCNAAENRPAFTG